MANLMMQNCPDRLTVNKRYKLRRAGGEEPDFSHQNQGTRPHDVVGQLAGAPFAGIGPHWGHLGAHHTICCLCLILILLLPKVLSWKLGLAAVKKSAVAPMKHVGCHRLVCRLCVLSQVPSQIAPTMRVTDPLTLLSDTF